VRLVRVPLELLRPEVFLCRARLAAQVAGITAHQVTRPLLAEHGFVRLVSVFPDFVRQALLCHPGW